MISVDKILSKTNNDLIWALWNWNGNVNAEIIKGQFTSLLNDGFNGIIVRPSSDISCGFMTDEFIEYFKYLLNLAKKEKIHIMFADDLCRPADSLFYSTIAKDRCYRSERLVLAERSFCQRGSKFKFEPEPFTKSYIVAMPAENRKLSTEETITVYDGKHTDENGKVSWKAPNTNDWIVMRFGVEYEKNRDNKFIPNMYNSKLAEIYF